MGFTLMKSWNLTRKFTVSILAALVLVFTIMGVIINVHEKNVLLSEINSKGNNLPVSRQDIGRTDPELQFLLSRELCPGYRQRRRGHCLCGHFRTRTATR